MKSSADRRQPTKPRRSRMTYDVYNGHQEDQGISGSRINFSRRLPRMIVSKGTTRGLLLSLSST